MALLHTGAMQRILESVPPGVEGEKDTILRDRQKWFLVLLQD